MQNFPTVGLIDGLFRENLEETGMSYGLEVELIRRRAGPDLLTTPYVFSVDEARAMTEAGADVVVAHMGLTTGGTIGADTARTLDDCVEPVQAWAAAARQVRDDVIVLVHGGPVAEPDDARFMLEPATSTASTAPAAWSGCPAGTTPWPLTDPRTTMRYDRARTNLDRHPNYRADRDNRRWRVSSTQPLDRSRLQVPRLRVGAMTWGHPSGLARFNPADPQTTKRYDRARTNLDRHPNYRRAQSA